MSQAEEQAAHTTNPGSSRTGNAQSSLTRRPPAGEPSHAAAPETAGYFAATAGLAIVEQQLAALAERDERVVVVSLLPRARMTALSDACGKRFREAGGEWDQALQWCARHAGAQCRPVVLLSAEAIRACFDRLARELGPGRAAVTLVVCSDAPKLHNGAPRLDPLAVPLLRLVDDLAIMVPADRRELQAMLELCVEHDGPAALCARDGLAEPRDSAPASFRLGEAELLERGRDVALLALGPGVYTARSAARKLVRQGVNAMVVNARFVHPLDTGLLIRSARRSRAVAIVEDGEPRGGFASAVLELLAEHAETTPVRVLHLASVVNGNATSNGAAVEKLVDQIDELARAPRNAERTINDLLLSATSDGQGRANRQATLRVSPAASEHHAACIRRQVLSPTVRRWVNAYSRIGQRTTYLWKWCLHGLRLTTLPCVASEWRAHVCDTKLLGVMLGVLLDDVADHPGCTDFLDALVDLVSGTGGADLSGFSAKQQEYAGVTSRFRDEFHQRAADYPCYEVYAELLRFDNLQVWNTMRYADLLNRHLSLLNLVEHDLYLTHNMQMMSFATLDLMCSPDFECTELGRVREAVWHAQCMARIGNLVSTWQREISERDFTSAVFARAVLCGELTPEQLASDDCDRIEATICNGRHEEHFLRCWQQQREHLRSMRPHIRSFDLGQLVHGMDRLIEMELSSRGQK